LETAFFEADFFLETVVLELFFDITQPFTTKRSGNMVLK
jgi:hypothetical protein